MNATRAAQRVKVTGDGKGVAGHAGALLMAELADRVRLTEGLSAAMAHTRQRRSAHDPGVVLAHLAVSLADGGDCLSDIAVLRNQPDLFGSVASDPTVFRVIDSIHSDGLRNIAAARAAARARAWVAGATPGEIVIDIDGTLVDAHSDKQDATPTYKRGFGFYPIVAYLDESGEALAGLLRPGRAGSNNAADHLDAPGLGSPTSSPRSRDYASRSPPERAPSLAEPRRCARVARLNSSTQATSRQPRPPIMCSLRPDPSPRTRSAPTTATTTAKKALLKGPG